MLRISLLSFLIWSVISATTHGFEKNILIERQKLICMYEQIDDLLDEPDDHLVMVVLTNQCSQPSNVKNDMALRSPPKLNMATSKSQDGSSEVTLVPNDILMLTHEQLHCFKSNFQKIIANQSDPVTVNFKSTCNTD